MLLSLQVQIWPPPLMNTVCRLEVRRMAQIHCQLGRRKEVQRLSFLPKRSHEQVPQRILRCQPPNATSSNLCHSLPMLKVARVFRTDMILPIHKETWHIRRQTSKVLLGLPSLALQSHSEPSSNQAACEPDPMSHLLVFDSLNWSSNKWRVKKKCFEMDATFHHVLSSKHCYGWPQRMPS